MPFSTLGPLLRRALVSAFVIGLVGLMPASAQEQPSDSPALPDIAPREIEIRGTLEIALPSLQRQPLSGFNPPPRIPEIPATRTPYVGRYNPDGGDLPRPTPDPPQLQVQLDEPAPPLNGELEAGGGRYFTRFAAGQLWAPLTGQESLTVNGDYRGSAGFEPFDDRPDAESPFDTFTGSVGLESRRESVSLDAQVGGFVDTYTLYGTTVNTSNPLSPSVRPRPERNGTHIAAQADVQTHGTVAVSMNGSISGTEYETTVFSGRPTNDRLLSERRMRLGGNVHVPVRSAQGRLDAQFHSAGLAPDGEFSNDVSTFDGGVQAVLSTRPDLRVRVGGRFLATSVGPDAAPSITERRSARFFVPSFALDWTASDILSIYLENEPSVTPHSLADMLQENPYVLEGASVQPALHTTDTEGGMRLFTGALQLVAYAGYRYTVNRQYFTSTSDALPAPGEPLYDIGALASQYGSARTIRAGAEVSLQRMGGVEVSLGGNYRNAVLVGPDVAVPYIAPFGGYAVLSYAFADQKGLIQLTGRAAGARYIDTSETTEIDPYVDLDVSASFDLTPSLGLLVSVENMAGAAPERWAGYPQPPFVFTSGLRVQW